MITHRSLIYAERFCKSKKTSSILTNSTVAFTLNKSFIEI